jgi:hypothetical protein
MHMCDLRDGRRRAQPDVAISATTAQAVRTAKAASGAARSIRTKSKAIATVAAPMRLPSPRTLLAEGTRNSARLASEAPARRGSPRRLQGESRGRSGPGRARLRVRPGLRGRAKGSRPRRSSLLRLASTAPRRTAGMSRDREGRRDVDRAVWRRGRPGPPRPEARGPMPGPPPRPSPGRRGSRPEAGRPSAEARARGGACRKRPPQVAEGCRPGASGARTREWGGGDRQALGGGSGLSSTVRQAVADS